MVLKQINIKYHSAERQGNIYFFDADPRGSHTCVPTHQRPDYPKRGKSHLRSAGLSFSRAGSHPLDN